jgi:integrase
LLRAIPDDELGTVELPLYLTAALAGLRQGELIPLRWRDVDWTTGVIRVRRSITSGKLGAPKCKRPSRAVPMADRVAAELERHFQRTAFQDADDLVFGHPHTEVRTTPQRYASASRALGMMRDFVTICACTSSGTHSARGWPLPARRCDSFRSPRSACNA